MKSSDWLKWSPNGLYASFHHPCFKLVRDLLKNFFGLSRFSNFKLTNQIKAGRYWPMRSVFKFFLVLETVLSVSYSFQNHLNRKKDRWIFGKAQTERYHVMLFGHLSDFLAVCHHHPNRPLHRNRHYQHLNNWGIDKRKHVSKILKDSLEQIGALRTAQFRFGFGVRLTNNDNGHGKIWSLDNFMFCFLKISYSAICQNQ